MSHENILNVGNISETGTIVRGYAQGFILTNLFSSIGVVNTSHLWTFYEQYRRLVRTVLKSEVWLNEFKSYLTKMASAALCGDAQLKL